jgi:hypothetical protein
VEGEEERLAEGAAEGGAAADDQATEIENMDSIAESQPEKDAELLRHANTEAKTEAEAEGMFSCGVLWQLDCFLKCEYIG